MAIDEQLIEQIQEGKSEAYGQLFHRYYQQIYSICFSILKNPHDAEEVTQETFVQAYLKLDQLKNPDKFFAWLKKIAQNHSKKYARQMGPEIIPLDLASAQTATQIAPDEHFLRRELIDSIMEAVEALSPKDREVVRAHIDGLSHAEISTQLGISISASMNRLYRARKKIAAHVKDLLNAIFGLPRMLPLKKIISGGILAMKIGTSTKITIGVVGVFVAGFIGFQIMTPKPTKNKEHLSTPNQQEMSEESTEVPAKEIRIARTPQPTRANKHTESSEEEREEESEALLRSLEEEEVEDVQSEVASETEVPETEDSETTISPELETLFIVVKDWRNKQQANYREALPLSNRFARLVRREQEIHDASVGTSGEENQRLHEELRQVREEMEEVNASLNPLIEEREQLTRELEEYVETHYGMTLRRFFDTHGEAFDSWRKAQ